MSLIIDTYHKIIILILVLSLKVANKNIIKSILNYTTDINTGIYGATPLMFAASYCEKDIVELLLSYGADANLQTDEGSTALMFASTKGSKEIVELLLSHGADANLQADDGVTALMCAASHNHGDIVKLLLSYGADVNIQDNEGSTVMLYTTNTTIINYMEEAKNNISNSNLSKRKRFVVKSKQTQRNKTSIKQGSHDSLALEAKRRLEL